MCSYYIILLSDQGILSTAIKCTLVYTVHAFCKGLPQIYKVPKLRLPIEEFLIVLAMSIK